MARGMIHGMGAVLVIIVVVSCGWRFHEAKGALLIGKLWSSWDNGLRVLHLVIINMSRSIPTPVAFQSAVTRISLGPSPTGRGRLQGHEF